MRVPLGSLFSVPGSSPRTDIKRSRVDFFKSLYADAGPNNPLPPLRVVMVRDAKTGIVSYAIEDGFSRYHALKENNAGEADVDVRQDLVLTIDESTSEECRRFLLLRATEWNSRHGDALTMKERKEVVKSLYDLGCTPMEIVATGLASKATIYNWLEDFVATDKQAKLEDREKTKEKVRELRLAGESIKAIAAKVGKSRSTVKIMLEEQTPIMHESPRGVDESTVDSSTPPATVSAPIFSEELEVKGRVDEDSLQSTPLLATLRTEAAANCDEQAIFSAWEETFASEEQTVVYELPAAEQRVLDEIYEKIRSLPHSPRIEHEVVHNIVPLLASKSSVFKQFLQKGSYSDHIRSLAEDNEALRMDLRSKNKELFEKTETIRTLTDSLKKRADHCSYECNFTKERVRVESEKFLEFIIELISSHEALQEQMRDDNDRSHLKNTILDLMLRAASVLEWMDDNGISGVTTKVALIRLRSHIKTHNCNHSDLMMRVLDLELKHRRNAESSLVASSEVPYA